MDNFRYPSSRRLVRHLLRALGYHKNNWPRLRTSARVFVDGSRDRSTPYSEIEFLADALDLMTRADGEHAAQTMRAGSSFEGSAPGIRQVLQRWDRMVGRLNQMPQTKVGGPLAALPALRMAVGRLGPALAAVGILMARLQGQSPATNLLNPFAPDAFCVHMDNLMRGTCEPGASLEAVYGTVEDIVFEATGRRPSRKTLVAWRTRPPGARFRFDALSRAVGAIASHCGLGPNKERHRARWLAACSRLRRDLDRYLGTDSAGGAWVEDLSEALALYGQRALVVLSAEDYIDNELASLAELDVHTGSLHGLAAAAGVELSGDAAQTLVLNQAHRERSVGPWLAS